MGINRRAYHRDRYRFIHRGYVVNPRGTRLLLMAICKQWVADGRPEQGRAIVERVATVLRTEHINRRAWYNQAKFIAREGTNGRI